MWRCQAWRGRAGQAFELGKSGVVYGATANSLAANRRGPRQDDQIVKTKPPAENCLRILDQGLGPSRACSSRNRPLERPGAMPVSSRVGWTSLPLTPDATYFASNARSGRSRTAPGQALVGSDSLSFIR